MQHLSNGHAIVLVLRHAVVGPHNLNIVAHELTHNPTAKLSAYMREEIAYPRFVDSSHEFVTEAIQSAKLRIEAGKFVRRCPLAHADGLEVPLQQCGSGESYILVRIWHYGCVRLSN